MADRDSAMVDRDKAMMDYEAAMRKVRAFGLESEDEQHSFSISESDGHRTLRATDNKTGRTIYRGPIDTPEQMEKLPPEIRDKVKKLLSTSVLYPSSQPLRWKMPMKLMTPPVPPVPPLPPAPPAPPTTPTTPTTPKSSRSGAGESPV
jgi:hypothetical protein